MEIWGRLSETARTIAYTDVLGLTAAGIGVLWLVGRGGPAVDGGGDRIYEEKLLRNSKELLYDLFEIKDQSSVGYYNRGGMTLDKRVQMLVKEVKPFAELQQLYDELETASNNPDLEVQVWAVENFFNGTFHYSRNCSCLFKRLVQLTPPFLMTHIYILVQAGSRSHLCSATTRSSCPRTFRT